MLFHENIDWNVHFLPFELVLLYKPEIVISKCQKYLNIYYEAKKTRAPRGTDRSPEYKEHFCYKLDSRVKHVTTEWNQKQQHFITHALDYCYEFGLLLWPSGLKKFFEEGDPPPWWPIWPRPRSAPGQIWPKHLYACARPWALHPYQVS